MNSLVDDKTLEALKQTFNEIEEVRHTSNIAGLFCDTLQKHGYTVIKCSRRDETALSDAVDWLYSIFTVGTAAGNMVCVIKEALLELEMYRRNDKGGVYSNRKDREID